MSSRWSDAASELKSEWNPPAFARAGLQRLSRAPEAARLRFVGPPGQGLVQDLGPRPICLRLESPEPRNEQHGVIAQLDVRERLQRHDRLREDGLPILGRINKRSRLPLRAASPLRISAVLKLEGAASAHCPSMVS
jgi:hypothetical protein